MTDDNDKTLVGNTPREEAPEQRKIGHYEVVAELGRGGMGTVYRAYESSLNRYVAIKELAPHLAGDDELVARFAREAKSVAALNHPNVVHIYFTGEDNGLPYFVMECIDGDTIAGLIAERGVFSPLEAVKMVLQAAKGLAAAHEHGIIHRDVKPSNLMVDGDGTLKIADFGIALARNFGGNLTTTGQFVGTTGYISPEVFKGQTVDARSDIFSLGVVLFEMLAGRKPFDDDSPMGQMKQVVELPAPDIYSLNPAVDTVLQQILERMLAKEPENRYQHCGELTDDLRHYLAKEPLDKAAPLAETKASPLRYGWLLLLLLSVGSAGYWWRAPLADVFMHTAPVTIEEPSFSPASAAQEPPVTASEVNNLFKDPSVKPERISGEASNPHTAATKATVTESPSFTPVNTVHVNTDNTPQATAPTDTVIIVRGDPALALELRQMLSQSVRTSGLTIIDGAFIAGLGGPANANLPVVSDVRNRVMNAGGRFLVMANTVTLGAEPLNYYGQQDALYTAQLSLTGYDLVTRTQLGTWGKPVRYTNLNAGAKTREAADAMVDALTQSLVDATQ